MKTVINPGGFMIFLKFFLFGLVFLAFWVFLLVFPEVRLFDRLESPSLVKGVFQGKMSVLTKK